MGGILGRNKIHPLEGGLFCARHLPGLGPHDTHALSHPCPQEVDPWFSTAGKTAMALCPCPRQEPTSLTFCLLQAGQAPQVSPKAPKKSQALEKPRVTRSSWGRERRREGPWAGLVSPDPGPTERAKGSQSAAHSAGLALMALGRRSAPG